MGPVATLLEKIEGLVKPTPGRWYIVTYSPSVQGEPRPQCIKLKFHSEQPGTRYWMFVTEPFTGLIPISAGYIDEITPCERPA